MIQRSDAASGPWIAVNSERYNDDDMTVLIDRSAEAGQAYYYRLVVTTNSGQVETFGPLAVTAAAPPEPRLLSVTPNPSRGFARIDFVVAHVARVRLSVIDVEGRVVAVLANGVHRAGHYQTTWNSNAAAGRVPAGLYFVRYDVPGEHSVQRMVLTP